MKPNFSPRWTLFSLTTLLVAAGWVWASKAPPDSTTAGGIPLPHQGFMAPDFTLHAADGQTITLSQLRGQPVLINLWASWCPPCRAEMPAIERVYQQYKDQGFQVLAVNATNQDTQANALDFTSRYGLTFPILWDVDGRVSQAYELRSLPTSFFVDPQGIIREVVVGGPMSEALLRIRVEQLLTDRTPEAP